MIRVEQKQQKAMSDNMKKVLVAFLYFIQGIYLNIPGTITLTYKNIPSYQILGYFSIVSIPFSLKFISAPIIEKYTSLKYGRRKTWLVISLIIASVLQLLAALYSTKEEDQIKLTIILFCVTFFISLEDICTDGLAIKELRSSQMASYLQLAYQLLGGVVGSLLFLEITSSQFAHRLGYQEPLITVSQFITYLSFLTLFSAILIHFYYVETRTEEQQKGVSHTLLQVIKHYVHFVDPKFNLCRQALANLFVSHGLHYFGSSYAIQLIKNGHISKEFLTTASNFMLIPILITTHLVSKYFSEVQMSHKRIRIALLARLIIMCILFFGNVVNPALAIGGILLLSLLSNSQFFFTSLLVNKVTDSKFAGMYVTMMASSLNFGNNTAIHLQMINKFGFYACSIFGFVYTSIVILSFGKVEKWIKQGKEQKDFVSAEQKQDKQDEERAKLKTK